MASKFDVQASAVCKVSRKQACSEIITKSENLSAHTDQASLAINFQNQQTESSFAPKAQQMETRFQGSIACCFMTLVPSKLTEF